MARAKTCASGRPVDPDEVYVCLDGHGGTLPDGTAWGVGRDRRLRGSDEAVQRSPRLFIEDSASDPEVAAARAAIYREAGVEHAHFARPATVPPFGP
jgi:hypothetical protein